MAITNTLSLFFKKIVENPTKISYFLNKKMILFRQYNENAGIDRVWYKSSNIIYSECIDNKDDYKTLKVVFKNGQSYTYKKVDVNDYVMFVHGGLDGSNGKALNKLIKPKYEFDKTEIYNVEELNKELENNLKQKKENGEENNSEQTEKSDNSEKGE